MQRVAESAAASSAHDLEVFDVKRGGAPVRSWRTPGGVASMAVGGGGGRVLVTVSPSGVVRVWDLGEVCPAEGR